MKRMTVDAGAMVLNQNYKQSEWRVASAMCFWLLLVEHTSPSIYTHLKSAMPRSSAVCV